MRLDGAKPRDDDNPQSSNKFLDIEKESLMMISDSSSSSGLILLCWI
jgi:hypothetical protein